jgi:trans-2-enoyl-CoA reductase
MGEPIEVLEYKSDPSIKNGKPLSHITNSSLCRVEMLHVPWNPADVNMVQGRYASPYDSADGNPLSNQSPYFHHHRVAGSEGWGRVTEVVGNDNRIQKGSLVTVGLPSMGTLRSSLWVPSHALLRVPGSVYETLGPSGCSLFQLGGTAMRMLSDFVSSLKPGDTVIQNAGNSGVGVMASQLAAASNIQMVSVVRKGTKPPEEFDALVDYLRQEGKCARVAAEEDLVDKAAVKAFEQQLKDLSETNQLPKLALNAVGGPSAQLLLKVLEKGGAMVTYGGMSGEGIQVATPQLIFKDLQIKGYWHSRWMVNHSIEEKQDMIDSLAKSVLDGNVTCPPAKVFPLKDVKEALHWQSEQSNSVIRSKLVFDCQEA